MNFIYPSDLNESQQQQYRAFVRFRAPKNLVRDDLIEEGYWNRLRVSLGNRDITIESLMDARLLVFEEDQAQARLASVYAEVGTMIETQLPDFNTGDQHNLDAAKVFFAKNPSASAADFIADTQWHPDHYHWHSGPKTVDLVAMVRGANAAKLQELRQIYGTESIDKALADLERRMRRVFNEAESHMRHEGQQTPAEKVAAEAAAKLKKESDPYQIKLAKQRVETLISGFRVSNNHRENYEGKAYLRGLEPSFQKNGLTDYFAYAAAVESYIDRVTSSSIR